MYVFVVRSLKDKFVKLDEEYEKFILEIIRYGEKWYREIDKIIEKMKYEISEMKKKYRDILKKYLYEIEWK